MHARYRIPARRWFERWLAFPLALAVLFSVALGGEDASEETAPASAETTCHRVGTFKVGKNGTALKSFCVTADDQVVAIAGPLMDYGAGVRSQERTGRVEIFDGQGKPVRGWELEFAPQSVAASPDGEIYVAGNGKVARYDLSGERLQQVESPHLAIVLKDESELREVAEEQQKEELAAYDAEIEQLTAQLRELEEPFQGGDKPSAAVRLSISRVKSQVKACEQLKKRFGKGNLDELIARTTSRIRTISSVAVADKDVFIATGVLQGYGFSVWRLKRDLTEPKQIATGLSGCCHQMNIQCSDGKLYAAENSRHRVVCFDRDGKRLLSFGRANRAGTGDGFGGCCNPMNLAFAPDGSLYTAESEGLIKKFTPEGRFLELSAKATLTGGCKNAAIASSANGEKLYLLDLPGSQIIMLERKPTETAPDPGKLIEDK